MPVIGLGLSANSRTPSGARKDLTSVECAAIVAAREAGRLPAELALEFDCDRRTISRTVKRWKDHRILGARPQSGRPKKLTLQEERYVPQIVKRNPRIAWKALVAESPVAISVSTLRRALGSSYQRKWRARKRIPLRKVDVSKRLAHARSLNGKDEMLAEVESLQSRLSSKLG